MAIEGNEKDTTSIKKTFLKKNKASGRVPKDFHTLDYQDCFVGVKVNILIKQQFLVKDKTKVFPSVFGLQN